MRTFSDTVKLPRGWLASRKSTEKKKIEALLKNSKDHVYIDLKDVEGICGTSADKIFGVLVMKFGFEFLINRNQWFQTCCHKYCRSNGISFN